MYKKVVYRHCHATINEGYKEWLMDQFGNRYYFHLEFDKVTNEWFYYLDVLPQFTTGFSCLSGSSIKEIVDALNLTGVVVIKKW